MTLVLFLSNTMYGPRSTPDSITSIPIVKMITSLLPPGSHSPCVTKISYVPSLSSVICHPIILDVTRKEGSSVISCIQEQRARSTQYHQFPFEPFGLLINMLENKQGGNLNLRVRPLIGVKIYHFFRVSNTYTRTLTYADIIFRPVLEFRRGYLSRF